MFSIKSKLHPDLKACIDNRLYKNYRVNIYYKTIQDSIVNRIKSLKGSVIHSISSCKLICAKLTERSITRLIELPEIEYITLDTIAILCGNGVLSANGQSFREKFPYTGKGVGVALLDSGVYPHADLLNPNKIIQFKDLINECIYPYDDNGHGTFMSGLICGSGLGSKGMYKGIAESSHLYAVKCFNKLGRAFCSDLLHAIEDVLSNKDEFNIKVLLLPCEILSMNYRVISNFSKLFDKCISSGIIPVVPSGANVSDDESIVGLGILQNCITVGGVDTTKNIKLYEYSSSGPCGKTLKPDFVCASVDIISLNCNTSYVSQRDGVKLFPPALDSPYTTFSGTSCSAGYVAGIVSTLFEFNPNLQFKDIVSLLKLSCQSLELPTSKIGNGYINFKNIFPKDK